LQNFADTNICHTLTVNIAKAGYSKPTPVQKYSIPIILAGRDLMACAQTGSGKTVSILCSIHSAESCLDTAGQPLKQQLLIQKYRQAGSPRNC
uniref:RNA helicase n=1 Tax=Malurus cyaneus samueli TaxID=2593467 RepID=A0A8C5TIW5_9PASS